jgi:hypothetical protein
MVIAGFDGKGKALSQVAPSRPEAGINIDMQLLNNESRTVSRRSKPSEIWKRCKVTS